MRTGGDARRRRVRSDRHFQALALAMALAVAPAVLAEAPASLEDLGLGDPDDPFGGLDLSDELALLAAEDVVVSATRHAQRIEESPSAITVITREQILASGYDDLTDLLRLVPGADVFRITQGQVAVGLRSRSTIAGDRMLVLVDGRDVSAHLFGLPLWSNMPIDVESIERIEVIRGPASTLYGANALQGVVNIVTRTPRDDDPVVEVTAGAAGLMTWRGSARAHGRVGAGRYWLGAGYDSRAPYARPEERSLYALRSRLVGLWEVGDEATLGVEAGVTHGESFVNPVGLASGTGSNTWPYLRARYRLGSTEIVSFVEWNRTSFDLDFALNSLDGDDIVPLLENPDIAHDALSVQVAGLHALDLFDGNRLTLGASLQLIHHQGTIVSCPQVEFNAFDPEECDRLSLYETRAGAFVQDEWRLVDDLTLTAGLRLDLNSLNPEPGVSPRAALVWRLTDHQAVRLSAGRAYRKPTLLQARGHVLMEPAEGSPGELARRLQHIFALQGGNPDLRNEKADAYEIGWRGRFLDGRLVATADVFYGRFHDAIGFATENMGLEPGFGGVPSIPDDATVQYLNSEHPGWSYGGEATVSLTLRPGLTTAASYGYDRYWQARVDPETGEPVWSPGPSEPEHRLTGSIRWKIGWGVSLSVDAFWASVYTTELLDPRSTLAPRPELRAGAQVLMNAAARWQGSFGDTHLELGLAALNVPGLDFWDVPRFEVDGLAHGGDVFTRRVRVFARATF